MKTPRFDLGTLVRMQRDRRSAVMQQASAGVPEGHLSEVTSFGSNPGALRMLAHVPESLLPGAPLVVALHGCTQNAAGYDQGCGWSEMADRMGFAVLLPEQRRSNNAHLCFNWFEPGDTARDAGEALSIHQMVQHMIAAHGLDPARVYISGLSAGGAMTAVMLATYPETFAAGAIIAGLPYGSGHNVAEALRAMSRPASLSAASRGGSVRTASGHRGPWPRVAVWHGEADATVHADNATESVKQWLHLHGLDGTTPVVERDAGSHAHRSWRGADGIARVESHRIAGMAHGVPLHPGAGESQCGVAGAYLLDVGVSSTHAILDFWGLAETAHRPEAVRASPARTPELVEIIPPSARKLPPRAERMPSSEAPEAAAFDPGAVITRALRAAGLMGR